MARPTLIRNLMPAVHLTNQALDYLEHVLAERVEPTPTSESIRRTLRTERDRAAALDELAHPFTSSPRAVQAPACTCAHAPTDRHTVGCPRIGWGPFTSAAKDRA